MIDGIRFLLEQLWPALTGGFGFGCLVGLASCADGGRKASRRLAAVALALMLGGGVLVSFLQIAPGRVGLWLDMGVLLLGAYLIGCTLGCGTGRLWRARSSDKAGAGA